MDYTHKTDQDFEDNATINPNFKYYDIHNFHKMSNKINKKRDSYIGTTGSSGKGGYGIYINEDVNAIPRNDLNTKIYIDGHELESCWVEIITNNKPNTIVGTVYRHPSKKDISTECLNII